MSALRSRTPWPRWSARWSSTPRGPAGTSPPSCSRSSTPPTCCEREPQLAGLLGVDPASADGLTPVEQETVSDSLEELLPTILWPPEVVGCAVVVEATTMPPGSDRRTRRPRGGRGVRRQPPRPRGSPCRRRRPALGRELVRHPPAGPRRGRHGPDGQRPCARPPRVVADHPRTRCGRALRTMSDPMSPNNEPAMSDFFAEQPAGASEGGGAGGQAPTRTSRGSEAAASPAADPARRRRGGGRVLAVRGHLDRQAVVQQPRLRLGVQPADLDPGAAVRGLRRRHGPDRRGQPLPRVPAAADVPAALPGAGQPRALPRGRHPAAAAPAGRRQPHLRRLRRGLGHRQVAHLHALEQPPGLRQGRPVLPQGHRLLRLQPAVAALPRRLRDDGAVHRPAPRGGRALPLRRHPAAVRVRPRLRRGPGPALRAVRAVPAAQGRRLLARPLRPDLADRQPDHGHDLHARARRAAGEEHLDVHRGDLRGAVLRQHRPAHLAAARASASRCSRSRRCCSVASGRA